ncbi:hypothetical protein R6Q57_012429 [Mikania cordata]
MSEARKKSLISVTPPAKSMPFADDRKTNASPPSISTTSGSRKVVIKSADMKEEMQSEAVNIAISAFEDLSVEKDVAEQIKKEFDKNHGPTWHCIVGKNFGNICVHLICLWFETMIISDSLFFIVATFRFMARFSKILPDFLEFCRNFATGAPGAFLAPRYTFVPLTTMTLSTVVNL